MAVEGRCDSRFARVRAEFERNFAERVEVGAAVCIHLDGEPVVDLWGGVARRDGAAPWGPDTICLVYSCTKGATAHCAHLLANRGRLDLDAPVATYWPEFAQAGKEAVTVAMLLAHQAGLPAVRAPLPKGAYYDWELMATTLAAEAPFWPPGTRNGYHAITFGWLVGEVVRRVSGRSLGTFFREEVAEPLGLDVYIGLPEDLEPRVAPLIAADPLGPGAAPSLVLQAALADRGSIPGLSFFNGGGYTVGSAEADSRAAHAAELGASGGLASARGLAGLYAPLARGGEYRGGRFVGRAAIARMAAVASATGEDATLLLPTRFGLGFMRSMDNRRQPLGRQSSVILSDAAFGHVGAGGSIGYADPGARLSFGYAMNKMGHGVLLNERGQRLVDAAYQSLGYRAPAAGSWLPPTASSAAATAGE